MGSSSDWDCDGRKVGSVPRYAESQWGRLGESSKSLVAKEAIWRRRDWALGRGGRRERRAEEVAVVVDGLWCCGG